jgi:CCR4-NOT transcription complex subunit 4
MLSIRVIKKNKERKQREKLKAENPKGQSKILSDRKHLHNFRVVQRNLVYVLGLPLSASNEELLRKAEYFGQYGKIIKVVVHKNPNLSHSTVSAYVTFAHKEDATAAIQALDGFWIEGHPLRASFGTTKYCNNFIRNVPCQNPDCVYLHELGDEDDRFTKEEIQVNCLI